MYSSGMSELLSIINQNETERQQQLREIRGARLFEAGNVCMTETAFYVQSETHADTIYEVQGDVCECLDYMKRGLPCKHILAVQFYFLANGVSN